MQVVVELLAGDAGLDHAVEILGVDGENRVHTRTVERDPAVRRIDMALERGADAERDDRRVVPGAEFDEVDHVFPGFGEHDCIRRLVLEPGQRMPMRLADRGRSGEAVAEPGGEIDAERSDRVGAGTAFALADGGKSLGHGFRASRFS